MRNIVAIFQFIPLQMSALCLLAISGVFAAYKLVKRPDRISKTTFKILLASAVIVPLAYYQTHNYWVAISHNPHPMALNSLPMNYQHLEALYFLWWCVSSILFWAALIWRKRHAA